MAPRGYRLGRVGSTLDAIHELAADGAEDGTWVVAEEQLAGRGTRGRLWHSPAGGLWLSQLYRPYGSAGLDLLSLRVGLAVADALDNLGGLPPVMLKWPNDIVLADRKAGGILCEARWHGEALSWVAIGVGLNVRNPIPLEVAGAAARLADWCANLTPDQLVAPLTERFQGIARRGAALDAAERRSLGRRDWLAGRILLGPAPGIAAGIDGDGALLIRRPDGSEVAVRDGQVELQGER